MADSPKIELTLINRQATPDPTIAKRRKDREDGRQKAMAYAEEALLAAVSVMRTTQDADTKLRAVKMILDRAWGTPKAMEDDSKARNLGVIEVLAAMSAEFAQLPAPAVQEKPVLDSPDIEGLLIEVEDDRPTE